MRILAIESSLSGGSVAVLDDDTVLAEANLETARRTAQTLIPSIQQLLRQTSLAPRDLELIAVTQGPGSFTGLRIGVTAAKTLAYALGAEIIGVGTLEVLAAQVPTCTKKLWTVLNAERQQLFVASYQTHQNRWSQASAPEIITADRWLQTLNSNTIVAGPPIASLAERIPRETEVSPANCWTPRAATVGLLGYQLFKAGRRDDVWKLLPAYLRESAAVEKAQGK